MQTEKIKFGTDGWRAIIAQDFTVYNVARVSKGLADWLNGRGKDATVVLGHDCRFGGELFTEVVAKTLCANGIKVLMAKGFISTPMISFGVLKLGAQQGVVITASHNPPAYNGYKLKGAHGGPSSPDTWRSRYTKSRFGTLAKRRHATVREPGGHVCKLPAGAIRF